MNKKYFVFSLFVFVIFNFCSFAQEKLFTEALNKGRQETDTYYWSVPELKKGVNLDDDVKAYAKANDICILSYNYEMKKKGKFYDSYYTECWFLPNSEIVEYVYSNVRKASIIPNMPPFSQLKRKADGWSPRWYTAKYMLKYGNAWFFVLQEMLWSGNVVDGLIDGTGVGVYTDRDKNIHILSGTFKNGFPVGEYSSCSYAPLHGKKVGGYTFRGTNATTATRTEFKENKALYTANEFTALISPDGSGVLDPKYIAFRDSIKRAEEMALEIKARESDPQYNWEKSHTVTYVQWKKDEYGNLKPYEKTHSFSEKHYPEEYKTMDFILGDRNSKCKPKGEYYAAVGQFYAEDLYEFLEGGNMIGYYHIMNKILDWVKQYPDLKKSVILADRLSHACQRCGTLEDFYKLYRNYGSLTQKELEEWETTWVLSHSPRDNAAMYSFYFPNGRRAGMSETDFNKEYARTVIWDSKRIIKTGEIPKLSLNQKYNLAVSGIKCNKYAANIRNVTEELVKKNIPEAKEAIMFLDFLDAYHLSASADTTTVLKMLYTYPDFNGNYLRNTYNDDNGYKAVLTKGMDCGKSIAARYPELALPINGMVPIIRKWSARSAVMVKESIPYIKQEARQFYEDLQAWSARRSKEMCAKCKIDASKTVIPKGWDDEIPGLFLGRPAQSSEAGKVVLMNGEQIEWKYVNHEYDGVLIEVRGDYFGDYKSVKDMMSSLVKLCHNRWE